MIVPDNLINPSGRSEILRKQESNEPNRSKSGRIGLLKFVVINIWPNWHQGVSIDEDPSNVRMDVPFIAKALIQVLIHYRS
jgi:hypothetical protein